MNTNTSWPNVVITPSTQTTGDPPPKDIRDRAVSTLCEFTGLTELPNHLDSCGAIDLCLDSLDQIELAMALEEEFGVELPDVRLEECTTFGALVNLVAELVKEKA